MIRRVPSLGMLGLSLAVGVACARAPSGDAEPRRETILVTEADDRRAGQAAVRQVIAEMGLVRDPALQQYVSELGQRLLRHAPRRGFDWKFYVVDAWSPNAFALPGGQIFVSRGLLALANSEDELAGVLGHEIVHAAERHAAARQVVVGRLHPFALGPMRAADIADYARDQEASADRGGQRIAAAAGFDPRGITDFLESLRNVERFTLGAARIKSYLDTHPGLTERVATTATRAQRLSPEEQASSTSSREAYLRRIDGLALGANPAEGIVRGSRFLHPDLNFALNFPTGWKIVNMHSAVVAFSPQGDARFSLEPAGRGDDPRVPAGAFLAERVPQMGAQVVEAQSLELACCPAYLVRGHANAPQGRISGELTWIAYDGYIYRIAAAARSGSARQYLGRGRAMARSFRALTPEERASIQVDRLRVVRARGGETLTDLIARAGASWDVQRLAIGNGISPTQRLEAGQLVKVALRESYVASDVPSGG